MPSTLRWTVLVDGDGDVDVDSLIVAELIGCGMREDRVIPGWRMDEEELEMLSL